MARATPLILPLPICDRLRAIARLQPPGPRHIAARRPRSAAVAAAVPPPPKQRRRTPTLALWQMEPGQSILLTGPRKKIQHMVHNFKSRNPGWKLALVHNADGTHRVRCLARPPDRKAKA